MKKIVMYTGRTGSGKTTSLLQDLQTQKDNLNKESTLVIVLDSELEEFKKILPNATYKRNDKQPKGNFSTVIIDGIDGMKQIPTPYIEAAKIVFLTSQSPIDLPKN
jgi:hypothetical protein